MKELAEQIAGSLQPYLHHLQSIQFAQIFFFSYDETNYLYYFKKYRLISKGMLLKKVRI